MPSRASFLTGKMPIQLDINDNLDKLPKPELVQEACIGNVLANVGYESVYGGKWHVARGKLVEEGFGFTSISDMDDDSLAIRCDRFIKQKHDKPFFMVASFDNPHNICEYARNMTLPWGEVPERPAEQCPNLPYNFYPTIYGAEAVELQRSSDLIPRIHPTKSYTPDKWRQYRDVYYRLVEKVDAEVGKVIKSLKEAKQYDNTVVIFFSDHGDGMGAHQWNQKRVMYQEVINVPLIIKPGKKTKAKINSQAVVSLLDLIPTICDYASAPIPKDAQGRSLRPLVEGADTLKNVANEVYVETLLDGVGPHARGWALVTPKYKYVLYNIYRNREQLVDLENDPGELLNLAVDNSYKDILEQMRGRMRDWAVKVDDKMLLRSLKKWE
ncbi:MAG: sulfatase-like hydrolase/transferase, partial [Prevotellaceae bacterium]|nr:sulfatase-like hydrolase/transferase [Prevotellaceae bacterium]